MIVAVGTSIGVIAAYLLAGGASYEPLAVADPCVPRSAELLDERGTLEGIAFSALDGAACELQVTREQLIAALAGGEGSLAAFAERNGVTEERIDEAARASLVRAVEDAEREGRLTGPSGPIARFIAERAPVAAALDAFRAVPGDPTPAELLEIIRDLGLRFEGAEEELRGFLDDLLSP